MELGTLRCYSTEIEPENLGKLEERTSLRKTIVGMQVQPYLQSRRTSQPLSEPPPLRHLLQPA